MKNCRLKKLMAVVLSLLMISGAMLPLQAVEGAERVCAATEGLTLVFDKHEYSMYLFDSMPVLNYLKYFAESDKPTEPGADTPPNGEDDEEYKTQQADYKADYKDALASTLFYTIGTKDYDPQLTWSSSNSSVVDVKEGKLNAVGVGTATVRAVDVSGASDQITITVKPVTSEQLFLMSHYTDKLVVGGRLSIKQLSDYKGAYKLSPYRDWINTREKYGLKSAYLDLYIVNPSRRLALESLEVISENTGIIRVEGDTLAAVSPGKAQVVLRNKTNKKEYCRLEMTVKPVKVDFTDHIHLEPWTKLRLLCYSAPAEKNARYRTKFFWTSEDKERAQLLRNTLGMLRNTLGKGLSVTKSGLREGDVTITSADPGIVEVNGDTLIAKNKGVSEITIKVGQEIMKKCSVSVGPVARTVDLNKTQMSLGKGETTRLTATLNPDNAVNKQVTWRTSAPKILTVDQSGNVKAVGTGTAWITARTTNARERSCKITVKSPPEKITLTKGVLTIGVGEKFSLSSYVNDGAASANRTYRTSDSSVVKMTRTDWTGEFVGVKPGVAYVTVRTYNGKEHSCRVNVKEAPRRIMISKNTLTLKVGQSATLSADIPKNTGCATRTFRTNKRNILNMTKTNWTGSFTAIKPGIAWVIVTAYNGRKSNCRVTVVE